MRKCRLWTFVALCLSGGLLGTLGTRAWDLGHGYSALWPAFVVQVAGGIWFGGWGVLAGGLFPVISNALSHVGIVGMLGFAPANFAQALVPAWAFRRWRVDPAVHGRKALLFFIFWGGLAPAFAGGALGSLAVVLFGEAAWGAYPALILKWALPHVFVALLIGVPVMRIFTPLWHDLGLLVEGWWDPCIASAPERRIRKFRDWPIQLKLMLAMCAPGLPLVFLAILELRRGADSPYPNIPTPLLLTLGLVAATLSVGWLSRQVIQPLLDLKEQVEGLTEGHGVSLGVARQDEIGQVGRAFEILLEGRRTLEERLRQAQKMEAVGQLAGGVAHDFNNLLSVILGYGELLATELAPDHPGYKRVEAIRQAGERAAALTSQLLAFSRRQVLQPVVLDLNKAVADAEKMLARVIREDIHLLTALQPDLGNVKADPGQIGQVIMNLALNARDAMPNGGTLTITTRNVFLEQDTVCEDTPIPAGHYVLLAVSDTGTGIDSATRARVFEPFFTTKNSGQGTGLGLATVYGIVTQTGGRITVRSHTGEGTTFTAYFPKVAGEVGSPVVAATEASPKGSETILLVEDAPQLQELVRETLQLQGYRVLVAGTGTEALEIARQHRGQIHLLITDVVMPNMGGPELAQRISKLQPDVKVLYMSGYASDALARLHKLDTSEAFIQKPFSLVALAQFVREVLGVAPGDQSRLQQC